VNATQVAERSERVTDEGIRELPTTPFEDMLPEVMAERGVRDLDELYSRYLEASGTWDRESFMRHTRGEDWFISSEFIAPVREALGLRDVELFRAPEGGVSGSGSDWKPFLRLLCAYGEHYGERAQG
jgi:hypothetical protein